MKLTVDLIGRDWAVGWEDPDDGLVNCWMGEAIDAIEKAERAGDSAPEGLDSETIAAEKAIAPFARSRECGRKSGDYGSLYIGAWLFVTKADAIGAMQLARMALKADKLAQQIDNTDAPQEQWWERQALAAGWTPPQK